MIRHNNEEDKAGLGACCDVGLHSAVVVKLDALGESLEEFIFVLSCPVLNQTDVSVLDKDVETLLNAHVVELFVDVACVLLITLQAEDSEVFECLWLMDH